MCSIPSHSTFKQQQHFLLLFKTMLIHQHASVKTLFSHSF
jgi:hypothetical protein